MPDGSGSIWAGAFTAGFAKRHAPRPPSSSRRIFENCRRDILELVYEKEDLLVDHRGKDPSYNFYQHAGVATDTAGKGAHLDENEPVNVKSNMP